jgi:hypothetical protein
VIARFRADLTRGGVGVASAQKVLAILQGVLQRGVELRRMPVNRSRAVRKAISTRKEVRPSSSAETVELMRRELLTKRRHRDAPLVAVLARAGC